MVVILCVIVWGYVMVQCSGSAVVAIIGYCCHFSASIVVMLMLINAVPY